VTSLRAVPHTLPGRLDNFSGKIELITYCVPQYQAVRAPGNADTGQTRFDVGGMIREGPDG
jgi:hypothetical protein